LLGLGAANEHLVYYPVDSKWIVPLSYKRVFPDVLTVGHWPSSTDVKGTSAIVEVVDKLIAEGLPLNYVGVREAPDILPWNESLKRMNGCDVYVETMQPELDGKDYGEWGNSALEAASMGKLVISNSTHQDVYEREFDEPLGIHVANSPEELEERLRWACSLKDEDLKKEKLKSRKWAHESHGYNATAQRLWDKVYKDFNIGGKRPI
jgi:hypothetical protein